MTACGYLLRIAYDFRRGIVGLVLLYASLWLCSQLYQAQHPPDYLPPENINYRKIWIHSRNNDGSAFDRNAQGIAFLDYHGFTSGACQKKAILIALHGSPGRYGSYDLFARKSQNSFCLLSLDLPGFFESEPAPDGAGFQSQAQQLLEFLDHMQIESAHFMGYSLSTGVLLQLAHQAPERMLSLSMLSGVGLQSGEGSGDYWIEQFKYRLAYPLVVWLPYFLPHFAYFPEAQHRYIFMRSFIDSDQRPLEPILQSLTMPVLILHGDQDAHVPPHTAETHHKSIANSSLVMLPGDHYLLFESKSAALLAHYTTNFIQNISRNSYKSLTIRKSKRHLQQTRLPGGIKWDPVLSGQQRILAIMLATFASEDLTVIATGLLIRDHRVDLFSGLLACFAGIFLGDLGLFILGWSIRNLPGRLPFIKKIATRIPTRKINQLRERFLKEGWKLIFLSRFMPGTRFPVYVGAGMIGGQARNLVIFALLAGMLWTPFLIGLTYALGPVILLPIQYLAGPGWLAVLLTLVLLIFLYKLIIKLCTQTGRRRLRVRVLRLRHPEFWPMLLFYAPMVPMLVYLMIRYRGLTTFAAANPGIPDGGFINEGKHEILQHIPAANVLPYVLLHAGPDSGKHALHAITRQGWSYPLILKPDASQKGIGLKLARSKSDLLEYMRTADRDIIIQSYDPGPYEAGIFYYRMPGSNKGQLLSITHKVFPELKGDGKHSLQELIWQHPRYRLQADTFCKRFEDRLTEIPTTGVSIRLGIAGNHFQGTQFLRGNQWITPELTAAIDRIARQTSKSIGGFYFGRFDVRYSTLAELKLGQNLRIIELNGATAESTDMYDPNLSVKEVYRTMWKQLQILYQIGHANRLRGVSTRSVCALARELWHYKINRTTNLIAD